MARKSDHRPARAERQPGAASKLLSATSKAIRSGRNTRKLHDRSHYAHAGPPQSSILPASCTAHSRCTTGNRESLTSASWILQGPPRFSHVTSSYAPEPRKRYASAKEKCVPHGQRPNGRIVRRPPSSL